MISSKFLPLFRAFLSLIFVTNFEIFQLSNAVPVVTSSNGQAMMYLQKYGYMNEPRPNAVVSAISFVSAVKDFQRFAGLAETGDLDDLTLTMMNMPRCGVQDKVGRRDSARQKRYALQGSKWETIFLTYRISKYPKILNKEKVDRVIARAFKVWSDVTNIKFQKVNVGNEHIDIRFEKGDHGECDLFDGPHGDLAHAFFPNYGGDAHFDDEEKWTINQHHGHNLFQIAVHEFGHSLGLFHSKVASSIMAPFSKSYIPTFKLDEDDIQAIQALYGSPNNPDLCQDSAIDAFTRTHDGRGYVFKGDYYWEVTDSGIPDGYPRRITEDWDGLPGNLDAAFTWDDGQTFFFKEHQYWKFRNKNMDFGYPRLISHGFEGIPDNIDAAFVWSGNGGKYFFKGDYYWKFESQRSPPVSSEFPKLISLWTGLPSNIDAAVQWSNHMTYFLKGQQYYKFNDREEAVERNEPPSFPRPTSTWWFGC